MESRLGLSGSDRSRRGNGAATIAQTLRSILAQQAIPSLRVVIAVNGTTDATETIARRPPQCFARRGWEYDVITTPPGRANAMNAAEVMLGLGDRFYVDQDAVLSRNAVAAVGEALADGRGVHFATPQLCLARSASWIVRNYYAVWERLPYVRDAPVTVGVYAVSAVGRQRWGAFPAIHSDDKFARLHFSASERRRVPEAFYTVRPPDDLHALLAAPTRGRPRERRSRAAIPRTDGP